MKIKVLGLILVGFLVSGPILFAMQGKSIEDLKQAVSTAQEALAAYTDTEKDLTKVPEEMPSVVDYSGRFQEFEQRMNEYQDAETARFEWETRERELEMKLKEARHNLELAQEKERRKSAEEEAWKKDIGKVAEKPVAPEISEEMSFDDKQKAQREYELQMQGWMKGQADIAKRKKEEAIALGVPAKATALGAQFKEYVRGVTTFYVEMLEKADETKKELKTELGNVQRKLEESRKEIKKVGGEREALSVAQIQQRALLEKRAQALESAIRQIEELGREIEQANAELNRVSETYKTGESGEE